MEVPPDRAERTAVGNSEPIRSMLGELRAVSSNGFSKTSAISGSKVDVLKRIREVSDE